MLDACILASLVLDTVSTGYVVFYMLCDVTEDGSYQVYLGSATLSINSLGGKEIHVYMDIKG